MSFIVKLQENLSPSNMVTKNISDIATATGVLREGTSILEPTILIDSQLETDILGRVNYAYIELWHRYYYVTDIGLDVTGLWAIHMHVDVLMSYATQIRQQHCIVARQELHYDMYLDDGWFMSYQNPIVKTPYFSVEHPFDDESYILVVAGS